MEDTQFLIDKVADLIINSKRVVAFTGAGVSTESGISDFRSPGGIWSKYDPDDFTYQKFVRDSITRKNIWQLMAKEFMVEADPNQAHYAIAELERLGKLQCVITQNVDNLHQKGGSKDVIEFHGNLLYARCISCSRQYPLSEAEELIEKGGLPPRCKKCEGILKPDAVFFGEAIPSEALTKSLAEAKKADVMIVAGTSAVVYPAAELPFVAKKGGGFMSTSVTEPSHNVGAIIIEINDEPTQLTGKVSDYLIEGKVGTIIPEVVKELKELMKDKIH